MWRALPTDHLVANVRRFLLNHPSQSSTQRAEPVGLNERCTPAASTAEELLLIINTTISRRPRQSDKQANKKKKHGGRVLRKAYIKRRVLFNEVAAAAAGLFGRMPAAFHHPIAIGSPLVGSPAGSAALTTLTTRFNFPSTEATGILQAKSRHVGYRVGSLSPPSVLRSARHLRPARKRDCPSSSCVTRPGRRDQDVKCPNDLRPRRGASAKAPAICSHQMRSPKSPPREGLLLRRNPLRSGAGSNQFRPGSQLRGRGQGGSPVTDDFRR